MKRILLLRHAKSSWEFPELSDRDRPLNARGRAAASRMGRHMEERAIPLDIILSSPAVRARGTAERVVAALSRPPDIRIDARLYLRGARGLLEALQDTDAHHRTVLLVGHNPALQEFATSLASDRVSPEMAALGAKYPTCALAEFESAVERWRDLGLGRSKLTAFTPVKALD